MALGRFAPDNHTCGYAAKNKHNRKKNMTENEKAFTFYAYNLSLISTGLSPQKATTSARQSFDEAGVVNTIQAKLESEPEYDEMKQSLNPVLYYDGLMELLITDPSQSPTEARNIRVKYVLVCAVIENRIEPEKILLHDKLFKHSHSVN